jgi:hypothetical protein
MQLYLGPAAVVMLIIGVLAVIGVPIVAIILVRNEFKRREKDKVAHDKVQEVFKKTFAATSSYTVEHIEFICTFDESGSGTSERRIHGLRATQRIQNLEIPFVSKLPDPKDGAQIAGVVLTQLPGSVPVRWEETDRRDGQIYGKIIIDDLLTPDKGVAEYSVRAQHSLGFTMTTQEANEAYKNAVWKEEYVSYSVQDPGVERLTIVVNFPASHHHLTPQPSGVVFLAEQEIDDPRETAVVHDLVTYVDGVAKLIVEDPKPLVRYAITWRPPDKK